MKSEFERDRQYDFQKSQFQFAAHIRNPQVNPPPSGIEDRRLKIYRELFFNNIEAFIASGFPVLKSIMTTDHWTTMVRDFVHRHQSLSPYFLEISQEFLRYLEAERIPLAQDPAFLLELAHYEWVELALDVSTDEFSEVEVEGDVLNDRPMVSPLAWPLSYQFPVHKIGPQFQPTEPPASGTHIVVYRDRQMRVGFVEINLITQRLLQILTAERLSGKQALRQLAAELEYPDPDVLLEFGADLLKSLRDRDIICGFS